MGVITVAINIQNLDQVKNATGDTFFNIIPETLNMVPTDAISAS